MKTIEQMFEGVKNGTITLKQFKKWVNKLNENAFYEGSDGAATTSSLEL